jgi:hypothetical protein
MNRNSPSEALRRLPLLATLALVTSAVFPCSARADDIPAMLDDFSDVARTSAGLDRIVITDTTAGGASTLNPTFSDGVFTAEGEIGPPRGQPGWVSVILLLSSSGEPVDLSKYEGIRIRARVRKGMLSITANSAEITNYDYHSAAISRKRDEFQEVRIPFQDMKRAWSEQTPLNPATIVSVSLVAVDFQKGHFAYDVDEVGFY